MKYISALLFLLFSHAALAESWAITDTNAYKFPPPPSSVNSVLHHYKKGEIVKFKYGLCDSSTCQVITPNGETAWIFEYKTTTNPNIEQALTQYQNSGFEKWDKIDLSIWYSVRNNLNKLDSCALKLAHEISFNENEDWPAFCITFKNTTEVKNRVRYIKRITKNLNLTDNELLKIRTGKIWVGATKNSVLASWGSPEQINTTTTSHGKREQWVYGRRNYVYLTNGLVTAIQN